MKTNISNFEMEHPGDAQLVLAIDQELDQQEATAIARHLDGCPACLARWEQLRTVSAQISQCQHAIQAGRLRAPIFPNNVPPRFGSIARIASFASTAAAVLCIVCI